MGPRSDAARTPAARVDLGYARRQLDPTVERMKEFPAIP